MSDSIMKSVMLHVLQGRALVTACSVDREGRISRTALNQTKGAGSPGIDSGTERCSVVYLEVRDTGDPTLSNSESARLDLDLAIAFLYRVMGAGGPNAEELRRMFSPHATVKAEPLKQRRLKGGG